jgi:hypothetical protein
MGIHKKSFDFIFISIIAGGSVLHRSLYEKKSKTVLDENTSCCNNDTCHNAEEIIPPLNRHVSSPVLVMQDPGKVVM